LKIFKLLIIGLIILFISCNRIDTSSPNAMLITSAKAGDLDYLKLAIAKGANINMQDENGGTPLHWAVYYNRKEIVKFLLMQGANPFITDKNGITPIDLARINNRREILKIFEEYLNNRNK